MLYRNQNKALNWKLIDALFEKQIEQSLNIQSGYNQIKKVLLRRNFPILNIDEQKLYLEFKDWLVEVLKREPIPKDIKSIYFGLANLSFPEFDDGKIKTTVYIAGSKNKPDEDLDWNSALEYLPKRRYLLLNNFEELDVFVEKYKLSTKYKVLVCNGLLNLLVLKVMQDLKDDLLTYKIRKYLFAESILTRDELYFGAGYDSGTTYILGMLSK